MKSVGVLALLAVAALASLPAAQAQTPVQGVNVTVSELAAPVPYEGSAPLPVEVTVGCATILEAMAGGSGSAPLTVTTTTTFPWLTVTPFEANLASPESAQECLGGAGSRSVDGELMLTVTKDAPGVVDHVIDVVASLGTTASTPVPAIFTVAYNVDYTVVSDATFPLTVNGPEVSWNVTVTQASNARSMVMMEEIISSAGVFIGPASMQYENQAGQPDTKVLEFTWKAPEGEWTEASASFTAYGHYLLTDGRAGDYDAGTPVTYAFVAGEGATPGGDGGDDSQDAPAPVGPLLALGLFALAAVLRRRA